MTNYKYILTYIDGDKKVTHEFPAAITIHELADNLRNFLCGCSWSEDMLEEILRCE